MRVKWHAISLVLAGLTLLWLTKLLLRSVKSVEVLALLFPPGVNPTRLHHLINLMILFSGAVGCLAALRGPRGRTEP